MRKRYSPGLGGGAEGPNIGSPALAVLIQGDFQQLGAAQCSEKRSDLTKLGHFSRAVQLTERGDFSKV